MYSPKIAPDLIHAIHYRGKELGKPMTDIVDEILRANKELMKFVHDECKPCECKSKINEKG